MRYECNIQDYNNRIKFTIHCLLSILYLAILVFTGVGIMLWNEYLELQKVIWLIPFLILFITHSIESIKYLIKGFFIKYSGYLNVNNQLNCEIKYHDEMSIYSSMNFNLRQCKRIRYLIYNNSLVIYYNNYMIIVNNFDDGSVNYIKSCGVHVEVEYESTTYIDMDE